MADRMPNVTLEDVRLVFRNFEGKAGQYNREGDRNFAALIDTDVAEKMMRNGWNIKWLQPREDDEEQLAQAYIKVKVHYGGGRPPRVVMITSRGRNDLGEDLIDTLDWVDIKNVDLIIRPYEWEVNGNTGVTAYLKTLYVTINEDELDLKYADLEHVDDLPARGGKTEEGEYAEE